ncbi:MAG: glycosyltransferase family 4 protein [Planctomycetota bacterium]
MRIAVLLDQWHADGGGLEQYLHYVLPALVDRGFAVALVARGAELGCPRGVTPLSLHKGRWLPRPWSDYQEAREAVSRAQAWGADRCWGFRAIPCEGAIWTPMGGSAPDVQKARGRLPSRRTRALLRLEDETLDAASLVLPMSPMVERQIEARSPGKPQSLMPLPLLEEPSVLKQPDRRTRGRVGHPIRIVHCGRDPLRHGSMAAVEWFRALRGRQLHAELRLWTKTVVHGERAIGRSSAGLEEEGIFLHGWDGGFRDALADADLLFHPTLYDSFSLVCLEAAAAGVPVVTTKGAGVAEILPRELCIESRRELPEVAAATAMELLVGGGQHGAEEWEGMVQEVRKEFGFLRHVEELLKVLSGSSV